MWRFVTALTVSWVLIACGGSRQQQASPAGAGVPGPVPAPLACPAPGADRSCLRGGRSGLLVCGVVAPVCATTIVSITLDDALAQQLSAAADLERHGMRGTFFLNTWRLQTPAAENMTVHDAQDLQARGHEIGGHTLNHPHLTALSPAQQHVEICNDRAYLTSLGLDVRNFAYPFGDWNDTARQAVIDCRYGAARDIGALGDAAAEGFAPKDPFVLRAPRSIQSGDTTADIEGWITRAEAEAGWLVLTFHHVCDGCANNAIGPGDFDALLTWLEQRLPRGTAAARIRDVLGGTTQPPLSWPPG